MRKVRLLQWKPQLKDGWVVVLKYVPNLSRLEAAGCQIDDLEDGVFRAVPSVQVVNVARNQIRRYAQMNCSAAETFLQYGATPSNTVST